MRDIDPANNSFGPAARQIDSQAAFKSKAAITKGATGEKTFARAIWGIVWASSLLMIFEAHVRSVGRYLSVQSIQLVPGLWLSDAGLLFPIIVVLVSRPLLSKLLSIRGLAVYVLVVIYGLLVGLARGNSISAVASDLRTCIALLAGLCLALLVPPKRNALAVSMVLVSVGVTALSLAILYFSPNAILFNEGKGVTEGTAFQVTYLALCVISPGIVLASLVGNRFLAVLAWLNAIVALVASVVVMQTRALTFTLAFAISLAIFSWVALASGKKGLKARIILPLVVIALIVGSLYWQRERTTQFMDRMQYALNLEFGDDQNWAVRVFEAQSALGMMQGIDHLIGMGFGVRSNAPGPTGVPSTNLHLAILNSWWRFGIITFLILLILLLRTLVQYVQCWSRIPVAGTNDLEVGQRLVARVVCVPGSLTLAFISFLSGGWSVSAMLSLGIIWGIALTLESLPAEPVVQRS